MTKIKVLDLFSGAGGAAMGYYRAGLTDITGIDINPQPRYPFNFIQADALDYAREHGHEYDLIHASPPCQAYSTMGTVWKNNPDYSDRHADLIADTRRVLKQIGKPYIIENVVGARSELVNPIMLCGSMFEGLKVYRHRLFEIDPPLLFVPWHVPHNDKTPSAGRGASPKGFISVVGNGGAQGLKVPYLEYASMAMGIDWMSRDEISQAIPPAYTEWIAGQMMKTTPIPAPELTHR